MRALLVCSYAALTINLCSLDPAYAGFIDNAVQSSAGVVFTGSGTFDLEGLSLAGPITTSGAIVGPNLGVLSQDGSGSAYVGLNGPTRFGSGVGAGATGQTGSYFGLISSGTQVVFLPTNYVSNSELNTSETIAGATFASLGLSPGTYVYNYGSGFNADTITLQVGPQTTTIFTDNAVQSSAGVVFTGSGTFDLEGLSLAGPITTSGAIVGPNLGVLSQDGSGSAYVGLNGPTRFGSGVGAGATGQTGSYFGLISSGTQVVFLPTNYVSNSELNTSETIAGATFASLGLSPGTYVYNYGSEMNAGLIILQVGQPLPTAVPEPATFILVVTSMLGLRLSRRKAT